MRWWKVCREVPRYQERPLLLFASNSNTEIAMNGDTALPKLAVQALGDVGAVCWLGVCYLSVTSCFLEGRSLLAQTWGRVRIWHRVTLTVVSSHLSPVLPWEWPSTPAKPTYCVHVQPWPVFSEPLLTFVCNEHRKGCSTNKPEFSHNWPLNC